MENLTALVSGVAGSGCLQCGMLPNCIVPRYEIAAWAPEQRTVAAILAYLTNNRCIDRLACRTSVTAVETFLSEIGIDSV